jgi:hypothetical protein
MSNYTINFFEGFAPVTVPPRTIELPTPMEAWSPVFEESLAELSELVEQLKVAQPLRQSQNLCDLAEQALISLSNRYNENILNWAEDLARDVADALD